jgi:hypothetical protein
VFGNVGSSTVYNSYVYYDAGYTVYFNSRIWYPIKESSSKDDLTVDDFRKKPVLDSDNRPALNDVVYCDAGDRSLYDAHFPSAWIRFKDRDYAGGQRVYNEKIDIGAGEVDWRGEYTSALAAKRTLVAAAGPGVTAGVQSLNLKAGDSVVLRINVTKRGMLSLKIVSDGLVSVKCGEIEAQRNGEEFSFAVEPGTVDVTVFASDAEATVSSVKLPIGGVVLSVR